MKDVRFWNRLVYRLDVTCPSHFMRRIWQYSSQGNDFATRNTIIIVQIWYFRFTHCLFTKSCAQSQLQTHLLWRGDEGTPLWWEKGHREGWYDFEEMVSRGCRVGGGIGDEKIFSFFPNRSFSGKTPFIKFQVIVEKFCENLLNFPFPYFTSFSIFTSFVKCSECLV